jgi:hypothetical protein
VIRLLLYFEFLLVPPALQLLCSFFHLHIIECDLLGYFPSV